MLTEARIELHGCTGVSTSKFGGVVCVGAQERGVAEVRAEGSGLGEVPGPTATLLRRLAVAEARRSGLTTAAGCSAPSAEVASADARVWGEIVVGIGFREVRGVLKRRLG